MITASGNAGRKVLLADISGTNARFAVLANGATGPVAHMAARDYATFDAALGKYLATLPPASSIDAAILAVAGTVVNGRCALTNSPWVIDAAALRSNLRICHRETDQ